MTGRRTTVLGGGIVGLSIAHDLAVLGDDVTVVADRTASRSVSGAAAAVWFPYRSGEFAQVLPWLTRSRQRFAELVADGTSGVDLRAGTVVERRPGVDRSWTLAAPDHREATPGELPVGAVAGVRVTVPVISISLYLPWLQNRCTSLGVRFSSGTVSSIDDLAADADLVVVAAGMRSGELLGDPSGYPVRGQVVRLANPGLTDWITDDDNPDGMAYVIPRRDDIVCGGTADVGSWDTAPDPATEEAILRRTIGLVPALAGLPVVSRDVGLRPARDTIRLEPVDGHGVPVIACYGHGGSGVTLSWGCAEAVAALAG